MYFGREIDMQNLVNCIKISYVERILYCHGLLDCNVPRDLFKYTCTSIAKIPVFPEAICKMSQIIVEQKPGSQETRNSDFKWSV